MSVHKYPEPLVLTVDLNPKRLIRDEWKVVGGRFLFSPFAGQTGITYELAFTEAGGEFEGNVVQSILFL